MQRQAEIPANQRIDTCATQIGLQRGVSLGATAATASKLTLTAHVASLDSQHGISAGRAIELTDLGEPEHDVLSEDDACTKSSARLCTPLLGGTKQPFRPPEASSTCAYKVAIVQAAHSLNTLTVLICMLW